ncbi:L-aminoadipate-semialdehyde dehydrogenase-phosphopantetheinyl transferase [Exaiptasia diaphana]|uniref:holo-[acyl-carrier-protein] synthase n=1 Tax=Exaiptasia diaphana TaxID=2652724 RepID=A0A913WQC4_EXADI|nr:L-aminoadipate-semialdehyde dehydrogenase-phosphopantetheinyl transferase [Exaiptasia diaphana]
MRSAMIGGIRWAYKSEAWKPTKQEWLKALSCVQPEEKERIQKFVFKKDAKSSLIGRLLLRKVISDVMAIPYSDVKLGRTEKGKPVLENQVTDPRLKSFSFNISHQGDFTVLAAEQCRQVGIDVMKTVYPSGTDVPGFFQLMRKQFTPAEWLTVKSEKTEWEQLEMFYRHWV